MLANKITIRSQITMIFNVRAVKKIFIVYLHNILLSLDLSYNM